MLNWDERDLVGYYVFSRKRQVEHKNFYYEVLVDFIAYLEYPTNTQCVEVERLERPAN